MANYILLYNVKIGKGAKIEDFVIIGTQPQKIGKKLKTIIGKGAIIRSGTVIYAGNLIGENFFTGHNALIRESNHIGDNVSIGSSTIIEHHVVIEDEVRIHSGAFVPEFSILSKGCWLGPHVVLTNARYPRSKKVKETLKGPIIEEGAKIGANSTILPGLIIGKNALIGAGSVVTQNIPANAVAAGNPARVIKFIHDIKDKVTGEGLY